jgi:hypothetical protein
MAHSVKTASPLVSAEHIVPDKETNPRSVGLCVRHSPKGATNYSSLSTTGLFIASFFEASKITSDRLRRTKYQKDEKAFGCAYSFLDSGF